MSYTSQNQLLDRYGEQMLRQLTDRKVPAEGVIDTAVVTRALLDADALLDSYLGVRYKLPLPSTPRMLAEMAERVAIYILHRNDPNPKIKADYEIALRQLSMISKGEMVLDIQGAEPPSSTSNTGARTVASGRNFAPDSLQYIPDSPYVVNN